MAAAALALLALLVVPWRERAMPAAVSADPALSSVAAVVAPSSARTLSPEDVLRLFTGKAPVGIASSGQQEKPPQDAPWLQYLGRSQSAEGVASVFLKDTRSGKLITAIQGSASAGWSIVQEQDGAVIVKNGDNLYSVKTR